MPDAVGVVTTTCRPFGDVRERFGLVRVELRDAARFERGAQARIDLRRERRVGRLNRGQAPHRGDDFVGSVGPVERRAGVEDLQRALQRDLLVFR